MLLRQFQRTIERYHLFEKDECVIVGVSGGVDSMVLLHLLNAYREPFHLSLIVAYVNHGLRPEESQKETELVRNESTRLGFPFEYREFNVKEFQKLSGFSLQEAARKIRFHFFYDLLRKHHAQKIALGHNADDQVETLLIKLLRGSGLQGLKGMLPIREGKVIRPLLEIWREEIESFARENKIPFLLDSSNLKQDYFRNKIRLALLPSIQREYQPNIKSILLKTSNLLREENDYIERGAREAYQKMVKDQNHVLSFKFQEFQSLHQAIRWRVLRKMYETLQDQGMLPEEEDWWEVQKIYEKLKTSSPSFLLELPHGVYLEKRYDMVSIGRGSVKPFSPYEIELPISGRTFIPEIGKEIVIEEVSRNKIVDADKFPNCALMDYEPLLFPLRIRNFRPGDRFQPLGSKGLQKLKKFFIDHKIPRQERPKIPLLISGERIVWVVGYRIDERIKITEKTQRVLKITIH